MIQSSWASINSLPDDLLLSKTLVYDKCSYECSLPIQEAESSEYGAHEFKVNNLSIKFRIAKTTPTKIGQFVTLWKRSKAGPIAPFDLSDKIDFFIISTRKGKRLGLFIFPKAVLCEHGIVSNKTTEGKRAIRVYPSWDKTESKQAQKTQKWQLNYFLEIPEKGNIDIKQFKALLS